MADSTADASPSAVDATIAAGSQAASTAAVTDRGGPKIRPSRPSRPTLPPSSPNYPQLTVVDPAHYVISKEIARGGMGRILVARDRRLGREVALKEILVQVGSIARRFEREARITAGLQHPSIVSVHEAGTWPSGEPFYAMPYLTGRSLDEAIAGARTYAERLALLPNVIAVADAMAYAHDRHVVHRDLKPRNIIVGEFGETVVIDWGLAKDLSAVEPDSLDTPTLAPTEPSPADSTAATTGSAGGETTVGEVLGTPAYMPPEQAEGKPVDERADVYAIGAMLYHVIAGRAPFNGNSQAELLTAVVYDAPPPLRDAAPDVASELVAIVDRAMARDLGTRYPTARALAEDLRRFQTGQLVGAHRYSLRQLVRRWIGRHRTLLAAIVTATLVAIAIGVVAVQRVVAAEQVAQAERTTALARQKDAEDLMQFMLVDLQAKLGPVGKLDLLDAVAKRAAAYYDARGDTGSDEDKFLAAIARLGVGVVIEARGDLPGALVEYRKGKASLDALVTAQPDTAKYLERAIDASIHVADVQDAQGDRVASLASYREYLPRAQHALDTQPNDAGAVRNVFKLRVHIASIYDIQGDLDASLAEYRATLELAKRRAALDPGSSADKDLSEAYGHVGKLMKGPAHDLAGALAQFRLALALGEKQTALNPKDPHWLQDIATSHDEIGTLLRDQKDLPGALAEYRAGLQSAERAVAVDPTNTETLDTRATLMEKVGIALFEMKDYAGASEEFTQCDQLWSALTARDPSNLGWLRGKSVINNKLGDVHLAQKDLPGALVYYRAALAIREQMSAKDPDRAEWRRDLFYSHFKIAKAYQSVADVPNTIVEMRACIAIAQVTFDAHPTNESFAKDLAEMHAELVNEMIKSKDTQGALDEVQAALAVAQRMAAGAHPDETWAKDVAKYQDFAKRLQDSLADDLKHPPKKK